MTMALVARVEA